MKKQLFFILCSIFLLCGRGFCGDPPSKNPALRLINLHAVELKDNRTINPYIVNIIAIYELNRQRHTVEVKDYILWYFDKLNYPDRDGLTGTIYDYEINKNGKEISTDNYDSVDGYAGTFLYLLNLYQRRTGDRSLINRHWEKIKDVAYLIPYLHGEDGLSRARLKVKDNAKYLMDNCEAYAGIRALNELTVETGRLKEPFYLETETNIKNAVSEILYDGGGNNFFWAVDDKTKHASDWSKIYPDAIAQLFPIYFGLLDEDNEKKKRLWQEFNKRYSNSIKSLPMEQRMIYELTREKMIE